MTNTHMTLSSLTKVGAQLGSNPGGQYADADGNRFYVKHSKSDDHARNEVLATRLYKLAGAPVISSKLIVLPDGKLGTISEWADRTVAFDKDSMKDINAARRWFAVHAWLGNWDAIGLEYDNQVWIGSELVTVDCGGSLKYRAMGDEKRGEDFGFEVKEVDSMRHNSFSSGAVFGGMGRPSLRASYGAFHGLSLPVLYAVIAMVYGRTIPAALLADKLWSRMQSMQKFI